MWLSGVKKLFHLVKDKILEARLETNSVKMLLFVNGLSMLWKFSYNHLPQHTDKHYGHEQSADKVNFSSEI